jgi:predicted DCC family thiol-disulfide oxidoreductase YuxK
MKRLYVLFDQECGLCRNCREWMERQPAFVQLHFIPLQSPDIGRHFPGIEKMDLRDSLVVVSDEGDIYQGHKAWIMCLNALRDYRAWSQRLAHPVLLPLTRHFCELVSRNRIALSTLLLKKSVEELRQSLQVLPPLVCPSGGPCRS